MQKEASGAQDTHRLLEKLKVLQSEIATKMRRSIPRPKLLGLQDRMMEGPPFHKSPHWQRGRSPCRSKFLSSVPGRNFAVDLDPWWIYINKRQGMIVDFSNKKK
jgi:hypothetical protein